jgi:hypothetical protein
VNNFYVWDSKEAALEFFSDELRQRVTDLYGVAPTIEYVESRRSSITLAHRTPNRRPWLWPAGRRSSTTSPRRIRLLGVGRDSFLVSMQGATTALSFR